jgi:hypothetical protein
MLLLTLAVNAKDVKIGISNQIVRIVKHSDFRELLKATIAVNKGLSGFIEFRNIEIFSVSNPEHVETKIYEHKFTHVQARNMKLGARLNFGGLFGLFIKIQVTIEISVAVVIDFSKGNYPVVERPEAVVHKIDFHNSHILISAFSFVVREIVNFVVIKLVKDKKGDIDRLILDLLKTKEKVDLPNSKQIELSLNKAKIATNGNLDIYSIDVNTNFINAEENNELINAEDLNFPEIAFKKDISVLFSKDYLLTFGKLGVIPHIDNNILSADIKIKDVIIQENSPIKIIVEATITAKKGKPKPSTLTVFINLINNEITGCVKVNIKVEGMDFILRTIYNSAKLEDKINEFIDSNIKQLFELINQFLSKYINPSIYAYQISFHVGNDSLLATFTARNK